MRGTNLDRPDQRRRLLAASVTTKPEVDTVTELVSQQLSQVAAVSSNVPNIHGEQIAFQSKVEVDLRLAISEGYDRLVLNGLARAGTITAGTADVLTSVRRGISQLANAGYAADTLIIDAAGAEKLDLLQSSGTEKFWTFGAGNFAPGQIFGLDRRVTKAAGTAVADSEAFGRLYASPLQCSDSRLTPASRTGRTTGSRGTPRSASSG
jgi:hypothetical protein